MNKILSSLISATLLLSACSSGVGNPGEEPPPSGQEGVVRGIALDTRGKPITGAKIWLNPSPNIGLAQTTTDSNGRYSIQVYSKLPYYAMAWHWVPYRDKEVCLRLAPEKIEGNDSFVPAPGAVRNFVWKIKGAMGRELDGYYGGEVRVFASVPKEAKFELTLVPDGPLIDGSTGKTLRYTLTYDRKTDLIEDIPIGTYSASVQMIGADGSRTALKLSSEGMWDGMGDTALLEWKNSATSCVGSWGNGLSRAFIWVENPPE